MVERKRILWKWKGKRWIGYDQKYYGEREINRKGYKEEQ